MILNFNPIDANCVRPLMKRDAVLLDVPPFIDTRVFSDAAHQRKRHRAALKRKLSLPDDAPWLLSVAVVRDNDTGLLTSIGDHQSFAAAVEVLLHDATRRIAMGKLAQAYTAQRHDR